MNKIFYRSNILPWLVFASLQAFAFTSTSSLRADEDFNETSSHLLHSPALEIPSVDGIYVEQTDFNMFISDNNAGATTEIYRSFSATSGYQLIHTEPQKDGGFFFYDRDLKPRTTYYYRVRSARGSEVSPYDERSATTLSVSYLPKVTTRAISAYSIEITLTDRSYNDEDYEIMSNDEHYFDQYVSLTDSGRTVKLIDDNVTPGKTYEYWVFMNTCCDQEEPQFLTEPVTTPRDQHCTATGSIEREKWENIPGYGVGLIPANRQNPTSVTTLSIFSAPQSNGDNYGARVRGFVCAPETGDYVFWIASDDNSELYLSIDERAENKRLIASSKWTAYNQWDKYTTQQSAAIRLEGGKKYYIEALHKENSGADHLAVGWKLPNGTLERPIPGNRLSKLPRPNYSPKVNITSPQHHQVFYEPAQINIAADVSDPDGSISVVEFYNWTTLLGTDNTAPYQYQWNNVGSQDNYTIFVKAKDNEGMYGSDFVYVEVKEPEVCSGTGKISREVWFGYPGTNLSSVPFDAPPNKVNYYTSFETEIKSLDNYGSRMRGYVCVPMTGNYTFWISSDDQSQLYLSTDEDPANKKLIASVATYTGYRVYNKYPSQKSVPINLVGGRKYYIEALHKEGKGNDFISVAWQLPNGTLEQPIPGNRLVHLATVPANKEPVVTITSPADGTTYPTAPANVTAKVSATDPDTNGAIQYVDFYINDVLAGKDTSYPYEFTYNNLPSGTYQLFVRGYDNSNTSDYDEVVISVANPTQSCENTGKIIREVWTAVPGTSVSSIPVNEPPDRQIELTSFETPNYYGNDYGARIRGYICPPKTGGYYLYIASDDASELWLSTDANPANKKKIAYLTTAVQPRNWFNRPEQKSVLINLVAGTKYYIEALHKEGGGNDHVSVAWIFEPDWTLEGPIPGTRLSPYSETSSSSMMMTSSSPGQEMLMSDEESNEITLYPNPTSSREITVTLGNLGWVTNPRVELISSTGKIVQSQNANCEECNAVQITLNNNVTPGLYLVNVVVDRRRLTKKLLVK